jgi:hypothetical protein
MTNENIKKGITENKFNEQVNTEVIKNLKSASLAEYNAYVKRNNLYLQAGDSGPGYSIMVWNCRETEQTKAAYIMNNKIKLYYISKGKKRKKTL